MAWERIKASMKKGRQDVEKERIEKELDRRLYNALKASRERAETERAERDPSRVWRAVGNLQERSRPALKTVGKAAPVVKEVGNAAVRYARGIGERQLSYERGETERLRELAKQQKYAMQIQRAAQRQQQASNEVTPPQGGDWSGASERVFGNRGGNNASQELFGGNGGGSASQNLFGGRKGRSASQDLFGLK